MPFDPADPEIHDAADAALLASFGRVRNELAFAELVRRHAGWVQGVARRALGNEESARDAAQEVFILLARKAAGIRGESLGPWLHRCTVLICRNAARREAVRRRALPELTRHMEAMNTPSPDNSALLDALPLLDAAVDELPARDRALVVRRYMENQSWREIGADLGRSEDAARMALQPALEKLASLLRRKGIAVPVPALAALLTFGRGSDAAAAASLAKGAMTAVPAASAGRAALAWWPAAACLVAGAAGGWVWGAPVPEKAITTASPVVAAASRGSPSEDVVVADGDHFDLEAVLSALRRLEASGNDPAVIAQLAAALVDMPPEAIAPVVQVLRTRRWGEDSQRVAQACFHRWAQIDVDAAWCEVFAPDFLGAATKTASAVLDALSPGNPARLVAMFNDLPQATSGFIFLLGVRDSELLREHFSGLTGNESARLIARIEKDAWRASALSWAPRKTSADCAALAPLAAALPAIERDAIMAIVKDWAELDEAACEAYAKSLPPGTPIANMAVSTYAEFVAQRDPAAAAGLISGFPWPAGSYPMRAVVRAWLKADLKAARAWLEAEPHVPGGIRDDLIKEATGGYNNISHGPP